MKLIFLALLFTGCSLATQPIPATVWVNATDTLTLDGTAVLNHVEASQFAQDGDSELSLTFDRTAPLYGAQEIDMVLRVSPDTLRGTQAYISAFGTETLNYNVTFWRVK